MPLRPPVFKPVVTWVDGITPYHEGKWYRSDNQALRSWKCGHARRPDAGRSFRLPCPACTAFDKRNRKYIAGHVALLLLQLGLMFLMIGGVR